MIENAMERKLREKLKDGKFQDVPEKRSKTMSAIRGKGNKTTEQKLRLALVRAGIKGWKIRPKGLPGNPDFYFENKKIAVFTDGCFWHGCPKCGHVPKTRSKFWKAKIERNQERDKEKAKKLEEIGIKVLRFWEHELLEDVKNCVEQIKPLL